MAAQGDDVVPLIGARRRDQLAEALGALDVTLTPQDMTTIETAVPKDAAAGERYAPVEMGRLDSERAGSQLTRPPSRSDDGPVL